MRTLGVKKIIATYSDRTWQSSYNFTSQGRFPRTAVSRDANHNQPRCFATTCFDSLKEFGHVHRPIVQGRIARSNAPSLRQGPQAEPPEGASHALLSGRPVTLLRFASCKNRALAPSPADEKPESHDDPHHDENLDDHPEVPPRKSTEVHIDHPSIHGHLRVLPGTSLRPDGRSGQCIPRVEGQERGSRAARKTDVERDKSEAKPLSGRARRCRVTWEPLTGLLSLGRLGRDITPR